jgi:predicted RNase H-like HicB family nuclease
MTDATREYIAVIMKDQNSDYGVLFPDFLGCISAGETLEEAKNMGEEALQFHIDSMIEDGEELPAPSTLDQVKKKYKKAVIYLLVSVRVPTKATRINITIDEKLLRKLDKYLINHDESRSSFFAKAIEQNCR